MGQICVYVIPLLYKYFITRELFKPVTKLDKYECAYN